MKKIDLLNLLNEIADDGDINETLLSNEEFKAYKDLNKLTADDIGTILNGEVGKVYMQSHDDSVRSHAVETYKNGKGKEAIEKARLEGIEEGKNGKKKTPEMERIEQLEKQLAEANAQATRNATNSAIGKILESKKLPSELIDFVYGDGKEDTYTKNIETIEKIINDTTNNNMQTKLGQGAYVPPTDVQTNNLNSQIAQAMGITQ